MIVLWTTEACLIWMFPTVLVQLADGVLSKHRQPAGGTLAVQSVSKEPLGIWSSKKSKDVQENLFEVTQNSCLKNLPSISTCNNKHRMQLDWTRVLQFHCTTPSILAKRETKRNALNDTWPWIYGTLSSFISTKTQVCLSPDHLLHCQQVGQFVS